MYHKWIIFKQYIVILNNGEKTRTPILTNNTFLVEVRTLHVYNIDINRFTNSLYKLDILTIRSPHFRLEVRENYIKYVTEVII